MQNDDNSKAGLTRRQIVIGATSEAFFLTQLGAMPAPAESARHIIRVASNQGIENATLQQLMADQGFARRYALDVQIVEGNTISAPMSMLQANKADICMISGFVGVLPAIEQGSEVRLVGAAMLLTALSLYTAKPAITRVQHIEGRKIGIGGMNGLLHILTLALLRKKGVDPSTITFINCGSNAQVLEAVAAGKVDAGLSGIAGNSNSSVRVVKDGRLWRELPEYTYQPAYASCQALREKPEAIARCIAAYTRLFRYVSGPYSRQAYIEARQKVGSQINTIEADAIWKFIRSEQPYALHPGISLSRIDYLQRLNLSVGLQKSIMPTDRVVDNRPALSANRLLR